MGRRSLRALYDADTSTGEVWGSLHYVRDVARVGEAIGCKTRGINAGSESGMTLTIEISRLRNIAPTLLREDLDTELGHLLGMALRQEHDLAEAHRALDEYVARAREIDRALDDGSNVVQFRPWLRRACI